MTELAELKRNVQRLAVLVEQLAMAMATATDGNHEAHDLAMRGLRICRRLGVANAPLDEATDLPIGQE